MARHLYKPVGKCIYCGETELPSDIHRFGDEHIIPFALGGNLILPEASCKSCEKVINRQIETPVSSHEWGFFRSKRTFPTRNKKRRRTHIKLRRVDGGSLNIPVNDYSTPVLLYKFGEARILNDLPPGTDHLRWTVVMLADHDAEMAMQHKYPEWNKQHRLKAQPHEFARLLAKIAYGYVVAELGLDALNPLVLGIILGKSDDYFYTVGGTWDIEPVVPNGNHITDISIKFIGPHRALIIVDIRLFSATETPSYHVVVGLIDLNNSEHARAFEKHRLEGKFIVAPFQRS